MQIPLILQKSVIVFKNFSGYFYITMLALFTLLLLAGLVQVLYFKSKVAGNRFLGYAFLTLIISICVWGTVAFVLTVINNTKNTGDIPTPGMLQNVPTY